MYKLPVGKFFESIIDWLTTNLGSIFDIINTVITSIIAAFESVLLFVPPIVLIIIFALLAWRIASKGVGVFSLIGLFLILNMGFWRETM
ncbi:MAG: glycine/betaine ABC transporter, partial [Candidatus Cloacimonadota bacterium]|nr:glycine/betaine ABC transporter [Candidatus Cloacimonadota bacterium]